MVPGTHNSQQTQKIVARFLSFFALMAFLGNASVAIFVSRLSLKEALSTPFFWIATASALLFFLTGFMKHQLYRVLQFTAVMLIAFLAIWEKYDSIYGIGFAVLGAFIGLKYGFLSRGAGWRSIAWLAITALVIELSARFSTEPNRFSSLGITAFLVFFLAIFYLMYMDEIQILTYLNEKQAAELARMNQEYENLRQVMAVTNVEMEMYRKAVNTMNVSLRERWELLKDEFRLTNKELAVIQLVYNTGETNADIADILGIAESTVKKHVNRILEKMEARDRLDMSVLTRFYLSA